GRGPGSCACTSPPAWPPAPAGPPAGAGSPWDRRRWAPPERATRQGRQGRRQVSAPHSGRSCTRPGARGDPPRGVRTWSPGPSAGPDASPVLPETELDAEEDEDRDQQEPD